MTCIVGWVQDGKVTIGGDSAGVAGYFSIQRADEKVFINGECIFGFTSSFRMGQLLRYKFKAPARNEKQDDDDYIHTTFIDSVMSCLKDNGFARIKENELYGGTFLFGYRGKLYQIENDFQVGKSSFPFDAVGCGCELALGALHAVYNSPGSTALTPEEKIRIALMAATEFSAGVRPPYVILSL